MSKPIYFEDIQIGDKIEVTTKEGEVAQGVVCTTNFYTKRVLLTFKSFSMNITAGDETRLLYREPPKFHVGSGIKEEQILNLPFGAVISDGKKEYFVTCARSGEHYLRSTDNVDAGIYVNGNGASTRGNGAPVRAFLPYFTVKYLPEDYNE